MQCADLSLMPDDVRFSLSPGPFLGLRTILRNFGWNAQDYHWVLTCYLDRDENNRDRMRSIRLRTILDNKPKAVIPFDKLYRPEARIGERNFSKRMPLSCASDYLSALNVAKNFAEHELSVKLVILHRREYFFPKDDETVSLVADSKTLYHYMVSGQSVVSLGSRESKLRIELKTAVKKEGPGLQNILRYLNANSKAVDSKKKEGYQRIAASLARL